MRSNPEAVRAVGVSASHLASRGPDAAAPRVSIGLPVYNGEAYLAQALDSLLTQTYRDFEIVISDNGSRDGTETICTEYAQRDKRIRYFREDCNRGVSWNFNRVFELSRGEYFKWAAGDDVCAPTFLSRCVDVLDMDRSVVCCHTKTRKIDKSGRQLAHLPDPTDGGIAHSTKRRDASSHREYRRFLDVLLSTGWGARCSGLIRSDCLRRTRLIEPHYGWDKVLMGELSLMGRFHDVPEVLFFQRIHADASSCLSTVTEQQEFVDPSVNEAPASPRFRLLRGHVSSLWRYPLTPLARLLCLGCIFRYLFQVKKWQYCIDSYWQGTGVGVGVGAREELGSIAREGDSESGQTTCD